MQFEAASIIQAAPFPRYGGKETVQALKDTVATVVTGSGRLKHLMSDGHNA
jgi:hypothetical protein